MKIGKIFKAITILVILLQNMSISFCNIKKSSTTLKRGKRVKKNLSKSLLNTKNDFIFTYLKNSVTDWENILYFSLGVLSQFNSKIENFYNILKANITKSKALQDCVEKLVGNFQRIVNGTPQAGDTEADAAKLKANNDVTKLEAMLKEEEAKKQEDYCEIVKKDAKPEAPITLDCKTQYSPPDLWKFIVKAYDFTKIVFKLRDCLVEVSKTDAALKAAFDTNIFLSILSGALGTFANIFTFGVWGGIKGGYYLLELTVEIKNIEFIKTPEHLPFRIGQLIGKGILVGKSLLIGKKKLKKRRD